MQGEKTVFLYEQMKHFPKYFKRLAELEAYMSELMAIKKQVQFLISENKWLSTSSHGFAGINLLQISVY